MSDSTESTASEIRLNPCQCGSTARYVNRLRKDHDGSPRYIHVECDCGMRTDDLITYGSPEKCKADVAKIWNNHNPLKSQVHKEMEKERTAYYNRALRDAIRAIKRVDSIGCTGYIEELLLSEERG